jgi:selenide,water dikinase
LTDVTGFGLAGHALEIARGAGCSVTMDWARVPLLPGVARAGRQGHDHRRLGPQLDRLRRRGGAARRASPHRTQALLTDPQTSGGLLVSCDAATVPQVLERVSPAGL